MHAMKITDLPSLQAASADSRLPVPGGFAAMLGDAIVKESEAVQRPAPTGAFHAVRLDTERLAPAMSTVSLSQVGADGTVGGRPFAASAVIVHAQVPDGTDDVAAYDDKLAQLKKVLDLEDRLGKQVPVVLEVHTRNGFGAVDVNRFHAARDLYANTLGAVEIMNDDGRYNNLLRKYGGTIG
jgi:hypothetical protein